MEIVQARQQRIWRLPAVINFTFGSMGAGYYLLTLIEAGIETGMPVVMGMEHGFIATVLILAGFFALLFEAGNPLKSYLSIINVRQSWMSRELLFALLFIVCVGMNALFSHPLLRLMAGVMAFMFIVSQGFIIYKSRAILAWNVWPIPPLFVFSGLSSGYGLWLLLRLREGVNSTVQWVGALVLLCCLSLLLYYLFVYEREQSAFQSATRALRTPWALGIGVFVGLLAPLIWTVAAALLPQAVLVESCAAIAGAFMVVGTWSRNRNLIMKAGYFRSIDIKL